MNNARAKARATETASKEALREHCTERGWRVAFFEGKTGAPRTGIIDALAFRLDRRDCDVLQVVVIQLKGGNAGTSGPEIARLKRAASDALVTWAIAEHDGNALHLVPEDRVL